MLSCPILTTIDHSATHLTGDDTVNARPWRDEDPAFIPQVFPSENRSRPLEVHPLRREESLLAGGRITPAAPSSPARAYEEAQLALGRRMVSAGIDGDDLIAKIIELETAIGNCGEVGHASDELVCERDSLLRQLAEAALEYDAPLPGAQVEFEKAWQARAAMLEVQLSSV